MATPYTISCTFNDPSGAPLQGNSFLRAKLRNFSGFVPRVSGTAVVVGIQIDYVPNSSGMISGSLWGSNQITPATTFWTFEWWNNGRITSSGNWLINGNTDLDTAAQLNAPPVPAGFALALQNNGANNSSQQLLNLEGSASVTVTDLGGGTLELTSSGGLTNPMTAPGDLIAGGVAGAPLRVAIGTTAQVLTVLTASTVGWATGLSNPMTTVGDLIVGGASGIATRLAVGSTAQVLTVVGGVPAWATPSGGGSMVGANMLPMPQFTSTDNGYANTTIVLAIRASQITGTGNSLKLRFDVLAGATVALLTAVVRRTLPNSIVFTDTTAITWGGSLTPTFAASSQNLSDACVVTVDTLHDYYILVEVGASAGANFPKLVVAPGNLGLYGCGYIGGNQTATADASSLASPSAALVSTAQVIISS